MALNSLFERHEDLTPATLEMRRAIASLMEEVEAVALYQERIDATSDEELRAILAHNRDEEKEHAAMLTEWIRRADKTFAAEVDTYINSSGPITDLEG